MTQRREATPGRRRTRTSQPPSFAEEARLHREGYGLVAGLDEAGRGPLAGPVVAGVAVLPRHLEGPWVGLVRDSKQMTPTQRERLLPQLRESALGLEVGIASAAEVDELGIVGATRLAMRRALWRLALEPDYLLLDAFPLPGVFTPQKAMIHGDSLCLSIAAASIVAKVTRDDIMRDFDSSYHGYGFARHKGYGTREHLKQLARLGPCPIHRYSFAPVRDYLAGDDALYPVRPVAATSAPKSTLSDRRSGHSLTVHQR